MKGSELFPSKYLKSEDLQGRTISLVISHVAVEKLGDDQKLIIYFQGKEKGMVCNKTNFNRIALLYGDETDDWGGNHIGLGTELVDFQGKSTKALRIKQPPTKRAAAPQSQTQPQQRKPAATYDELNPPAAEFAPDDMSDEIPF